MARTVNEATHAARRNAILDATMRAIETKGYEQMAIGDILNELHISSGAFYHYFDSKPAVLEAVVGRIVDQIEPLVLPIIHDPTLDALAKLQRFFTRLDHEKLARKRFVLEYIHVWYGDENAIMRYKLYAIRVKRFTPWLEVIIRQGVVEGVFQTPYPDQTARMILSLLEDLAFATVELLLSREHTPDDIFRLQRTVEACTDAIERVLGAPTGCLQRNWREEIEPWLVSPALEKEDHA